jgi:hypothetical protein
MIRTLGPSDGSLEVRTYREGAARKLGHDLIIDVGRWQATVDVADDGLPCEVVLEADSRSLRVREGNGVKPLDDEDRAQILKNIDEQVLSGLAISFRSSGIEHENGHLRIAGDLTLAGMSRPATFDVTMVHGRVRGIMAITQSNWGITPFSHPVLPLKLRDDVDVVVDIAVN